MNQLIYKSKLLTKTQIRNFCFECFFLETKFILNVLVYKFIFEQNLYL